MSAILILLVALNLLAPGAVAPGDDAAAAQEQSDEIRAEEEAISPAAAEAPATAEELLSRLEEADADLETLTAEVLYGKTNLLVGEEQRRLGRLYFRQGEAEGDAAEPQRQFAIEFTTLYIDDRREEERRSFIFDGRWLVEKLPDDRPPQMFKREIVPPGESFDPLAIGEGPFPIPIGQKREEILRHYTAELVPPGEGSLEEHTYHIHLERRPQAEDLLDVETLDLWYLRTNLLPVRAVAIDEAGNETKVTLAQIERNVEIGAEHFDTTAPSDDWDLQITSWQD